MLALVVLASVDTNVGLCECRFFSLSVNQPPTSPHRQPLPTPKLPLLRLSSAQHAILHSPNLSDRKSSSARALSRSHPPSPSRTAPSIHLNWGSGKHCLLLLPLDGGRGCCSLPEAIFCFLEAVRQGARKFKICPCHTIKFDSCLEIIVKLEFLELGGSFVESIVASEPF